MMGNESGGLKTLERTGFAQGKGWDFISQMALLPSVLAETELTCEPASLPGKTRDPAPPGKPTALQLLHTSKEQSQLELRKKGDAHVWKGVYS